MKLSDINTKQYYLIIKMEAPAEIRFPSNDLANAVWDSNDKDKMNKFFKKGTAFILQDPDMKFTIVCQGPNIENAPRNDELPAQEDQPIR